ncbi:hypothetical protein GWK47_051730 [Chionoecetes opilio]|uniref:Uncharacterized protein n=1 Tax=Chionoecetes opilio TaxID=41210 RepID=A0A8J4Y1V2_CHIOP|nr:hypothetical protein GWK47_051730 [Chionoecetes opilio]
MQRHTPCHHSSPHASCSRGPAHAIREPTSALFPALAGVRTPVEGPTGSSYQECNLVLHLGPRIDLSGAGLGRSVSFDGCSSSMGGVCSPTGSHWVATSRLVTAGASSTGCCSTGPHWLAASRLGVTAWHCCDSPPHAAGFQRG